MTVLVSGSIVAWRNATLDQEQAPASRFIYLLGGKSHGAGPEPASFALPLDCRHAVLFELHAALQPEAYHARDMRSRTVVMSGETGSTAPRHDCYSKPGQALVRKTRDLPVSAGLGELRC